MCRGNRKGRLVVVVGGWRVREREVAWWVGGGGGEGEVAWCGGGGRGGST